MTSSLPPSSHRVAADFASLHDSRDIYNINFTSHRRGIGWALVLARRVLRTLLTPILQRQVEYNVANTRLWDQFEELRQQHEELKAEVKARGVGRTLTRALMEFDARLSGLERDARIVELEKTILRLQTSVVLQERRLTVLLDEARKRLGETPSPEQLRTIASEGERLLDGLYAALEDECRGGREELKDGLRAYVPTLKDARVGTDDKPIVDVRAGRGEWLEVLKAEDLRAVGVEGNRVLVEECRRRGLEVVEGDALGYLRTLADASVGAVTGFHNVERLPFEAVVRLVDETVRVLKPGGVAIFETANPENLLVWSRTFHTDPTRRRPLPSSTFRFLAEARGLSRVEVRYLHSYPQALRVKEVGLDLAKRFNEYFYGPQDYAIVGWKT